jgi:hypothetical protein
MHVQMHLSGASGKAAQMDEIRNGVSSRQLSGVSWRKSRRSGAQGNCVEVAPLHTGEIALRNSRHPDGPALIYTRDEIAAFLWGAKDGEFDDLLTHSPQEGVHEHARAS